MSPLVRKIVNKHESEIRAFQRALFTDAGERFTAPPGLTDAQVRELVREHAEKLVSMGGRSLTKRRAEVSVIMDRGPVATLDPHSGIDPSLSTHYFYVFTDSDGKAIPKSASSQLALELITV